MKYISLINLDRETEQVRMYLNKFPVMSTELQPWWAEEAGEGNQLYFYREIHHMEIYRSIISCVTGKLYDFFKSEAELNPEDLFWL